MRTRLLGMSLVVLMLLGCKGEKASQVPEDTAGAGVEGQLAALNQKLESMEKRLAALEEGQEEVQGQLERLTPLPERVSEVSAELESARRRERKPVPPSTQPGKVEPGQGTEEEPAGSESAKNETPPKEEAEEPTEPLEPEEPIPAQPEEEETEADTSEEDQQPAQDPLKTGVRIEKEDGSPLGVREMKFAPSVDRKKRQPEGPKETFTPDDRKVYTWLVLENELEEESRVVVTWKREGVQKSFIELRVGKDTTHWRTWCYTRLKSRSKGNWTVEVTDLEGNLLATGAFLVKAAD